MNVLTLRLTSRALCCGWYVPELREPRWQHTSSWEPGAAVLGDSVATQLFAARRMLSSIVSGSAPDAIGIHLRHGGEVLDRPTRASEDVLDALKVVAAQAPLHIPPTLGLARIASQIFAGSPVWLVPETAFFCGLPVREQIYGLAGETRRALGVRRFGYHGLYHEAACDLVIGQRIRAGNQGPARVLSVCLEPQSELAAVRGRQPVMVTSGATPLEGLPGETSCGELDPGIVLNLARDFSIGPEQLDALLSRQSGLRALAGQPLSLGQILRSTSRNTRLAREVFAYRLLAACGAGCGALGGADALVFSGRYARQAEELATQLSEALVCALQGQTEPVCVHYLHEPLDRLLADATIRAAGPRARASAGNAAGVDGGLL